MLVAERNTVKIAEDGKMLYLPLAAGEKIYQGSLVVVNAAGYAEAGNKAENLKAVGRAENTADNTDGADGAVSVNVQRGVFIWDNDATVANQVKQANLMGTCYVLDDCTVTGLATGASAAGKVVAITDDGIAVETL